METTVVNIHKDKYDIYIGRAGHGQDGTFGNPYKSGTKKENIEQFKKYFYERLRNDLVFASKVRALKGKRLGCFCFPKICHGNIIAEYLNNLHPVRLGIVESRTFSNYHFMKEILDWYDIKSMVSGGKKGADAPAKRYAIEHNIPIQEFFPDWDKYGKSARFKRNIKIVDASEELIAFWDEKSKGTKHSIDFAKECGKSVAIYWPKSGDEIADLGL